MRKRYSRVGVTDIEYCFTLVFDDAGGVRLTRGRASLCRNERAMALTATLPLSLFRTPELRGCIRIDDPTGYAQPTIDIAAAQTALRAALGVDIDLTIREAEQ